MEFIYPAKIEDDGSGFFLVTFRDVPLAATDGATIEEALHEAPDCLEEGIAAYIAEKEDIPMPSKLVRGEYPIRLPAQTAAKAALYIAVKDAGISVSEFARRIGVNEKEARRMLDPKHPTKLPRIESALAVLGKGLTVSLVEVAA